MTKTRNALLWIFALIFTLGFAVYQRMTGPTYPLKDKITVGSEVIKFSLPRSHAGEGPEIVRVRVPGQSIQARMVYKRYKSYDEWTSVPMRRNGEYLEADIPHQPIAGKVSYDLYFSQNNSAEVKATEDPVVIRFRGDVPDFILIPHIILIFAAMWLSSRTGLEVLFKGPKVYKYTKWTVIILFLGGMIMGPLMQWYAFEAFWTGWPFGHDLTDNKTLIGLIMWIIAWWMLRKNQEKRGWALAAAIVLIGVFLIPHSVLGSEIDYTKLPKEKTGAAVMNMNEYKQAFDFRVKV